MIIKEDARPANPKSDLTVFMLWCRLTGNDPDDFGVDEREAFLARPQVPALRETPYEVLLDAGITAARRGSLPLERWLGAVRTVRPVSIDELKAAGTRPPADGGRWLR